MKNQFSLKIELKCVDFFLKVLILTLIHPRNLKHLVELFVTKFPQPNTCLLTHGEKISWGKSYIVFTFAWLVRVILMNLKCLNNKGVRVTRGLAGVGVMGWGLPLLCSEVLFPVVHICSYKTLRYKTAFNLIHFIKFDVLVQVF